MTEHDPTPRAAPRPQPRVVLCPYCGSRSRDPHRCESCSGYFDPLSRQATQNAMGPWFIRDDAQPFRPGCSYDTLRTLIRRGKIGPETPIRGPTTRQFWVLAKRCPAVANLLGICHACARPVEPGDRACRHCGASFEPPPDRQQLGLGSVRLLPGHAAPEDVAAMSEPHHPQPSVNLPHQLDAVPAAQPQDIQPPLPHPDEIVFARVQTLERNLRVLRRSRAIYLAAAITLLLSAAFVFAAPSLGITLGPVDRWLGRVPTQPRELAPPDLGVSEPVPVRPAPITPAPDPARIESQPAPEPGISSRPTSDAPDSGDGRALVAPVASPNAVPESWLRLRDLARSGRLEELKSASDLVSLALAEGFPTDEATRFRDALRLRIAWLELRTYP